MFDSFLKSIKNELFSISDPASYRFGLFLCGTLTFVTIGAIVGIVAGNISHYRIDLILFFCKKENELFSGYFDTMNFTNISINISSFSQRSSYLWLSTSDRSRKSLFSSRKIRSSWSFGKKPPNNRRW